LYAWKKQEEESCEQRTEQTEEETEDKASNGCSEYLDDEGFWIIQIPI
jgi:hypothetical protein